MRDRHWWIASLLLLLLLPASRSLQLQKPLSRKIAARNSSCHLIPSLILAGCCALLAPENAKASPLLDSQPITMFLRQREPSSSLLLATYASEGSGGMPFLSPFQAPGATPIPTDPKFEDREARNRAFDDALDQDKRDRDAYYAKMALQAREKKMQQLNEQRQALGLDLEDSGPRFGDPEVASMASLKKQLAGKDPATMTPAEFREFKELIKAKE